MIRNLHFVHLYSHKKVVLPKQYPWFIKKIRDFIESNFFILW